MSAEPLELPKRAQRKFRPDRIGLYAVLIISSLIMAFPLLFSLSGSVSSLEDYIRTPWFPIPYQFTLGNYLRVIFDITSSNLSPVMLWVRNTLIRAAWYIIIPAIVAVMVR